MYRKPAILIALALAAGLSLALGLLGMTMFRGQGRA